MENELGIFPFDVSDAYFKQVEAAEEADAIAAKLQIDPDYDWESDEKTPITHVQTMGELMNTINSSRPSIVERKR